MGRDSQKAHDQHESSSKKNKKEKKQKKEKQKKKDKKQRKEDKQIKIQKKNQWGKYGTISNADIYQKREEFLMWLSEVKRLNIEAITPQEEKKYFEEYVECYNTATFPSQKFYNFKVWFEKEQLKGHIQQTEMQTFDDEKEKQKEQQEEKEFQKRQKLQREYQHLHEFQNIALDMQKQKQLQELLRHHLQMGNHDAAIKIQKQLNPVHTIDMNQIQQQPPIDYDYDYDNF